MALNAKTAKGGDNSKSYPILDPGSYPARLAQIIDLGIQPQVYKGEEKTPRQEIMLTYELLDEYKLDENGNPDEEFPRWLSEQLPLHNLKSEKAKSTNRYFALDPKVEHDGDFTQLGGRPVMLTLIQNQSKGKTYNNIAGASAMRDKEAAKAPELKHDVKVFMMDDPDMEIYGSLPDWVREKIEDSLEYEGSPLAALVTKGATPVAKEAKAPVRASKLTVDTTDENDKDDEIAW